MNGDARTMRVVRQHAFGGPGVLVFEEVPVPACPPGGYVVRTKAVGVNFADVVERRGLYRRDPTLPLVLGKEASGVVEEAGAHTSRFVPGDAVIVVDFSNGCYAERIVVTEEHLLPPPEGFDFVEMAAFAASFATAWFALREVARVRPGDALLVQAAAGGLGTAAVQLGRALGCDPVLGAAGSAAKCALVRSLGATACADTSRDDVRDLVREVTDGRGVDVCLDSVGGETAERSLQALAPLGRMVVLGFSSVERDHARACRPVHPLTLLHRSISIGGLDTDALAIHRRLDDWHELVAFCARHALRPVVGATHPLARAADAHAALEGRATVGKTVLLVDGATQPVR